MLYPIVLHIHSFLRYIALIILVYAVAYSFLGLYRKKPFFAKELKVSLITMIIFHTQLLFGLILYIMSPKVQFTREMFHTALFRYFTIEHVFSMVIAIALITIGYSMAKKQIDGNGHKFIFYFYLIALLIILWAIPWPFKAALGSGWI